MDNKDIVAELELLINEAYEVVLPTKWDPQVIGGVTMVAKDKYVGWYTKCIIVLGQLLDDENKVYKQFLQYEKNYYSYAKAAVKMIESVRDYCKKGIIEVSQNNQPPIDWDCFFSKFHAVARQLRNRHQNRETLRITDEYDVQDLLHALLRLYFEDIRPEEWVPSYAGKASRVDFLLKNEKVIIEVKKTRDHLEDKEIGDQLIIDIERYQAHPDCDRLICFVYDPEGRIGNPVGLKNDLENRHNGFLNIYIEPL